MRAPPERGSKARDGLAVARVVASLDPPIDLAGEGAAETRVGLVALALELGRRPGGHGSPTPGVRRKENAAIRERLGRDVVASLREAAAEDLPRHESASVYAGRLYEALLALESRRRSGAHYTPMELARRVTDTTLGPILERCATADDVLALVVCDPAMGTGAFLLAAAERLARELALRFGFGERRALDAVARRCLSGVDVDPGAVAVARRALAMACLDTADEGALEDSLVAGDALGCKLVPDRKRAIAEVYAFFAERGSSPPRALHWGSFLPGGADAFVGNPPFVGGKRIATTHGSAYAAWLRVVHPDASGNVDLAAHFLRRAFDLLRPGGRVGFIVTNTIAQGDTRRGGLEAIVARGGRIVEARAREPWPGDAAVVTSLVFVEAPRAGGSARTEPAILDGVKVRHISPYLRAEGHDAPPPRLVAVPKRAFIGCFVRGVGFTFDDATDGALSLAEMREALRANRRNARVVRPYIGGEEVVRRFDHAHHRYIIDLAGLSLAEARARHPELVALLEKKARPFRESLGESPVDRAHKKRWWTFANDRPELRRAIAGLERVLVLPRVTARLAATFLPSGMVYSDQLVVVALDSWSAFALLQSRVHEAWARAFSSTLGVGLRYTPSACFETFPWPRAIDGLEDVGRRTFEARAAWMRETREGLTATYNRIADPSERCAGIEELRALHAELDAAVFDAYGGGPARLRATVHRAGSGQAVYGFSPADAQAVVAWLRSVPTGGAPAAAASPPIVREPRSSSSLR